VVVDLEREPGYRRPEKQENKNKYDDFLRQAIQLMQPHVKYTLISQEEEESLE
jgi:hypothetical protein